MMMFAADTDHIFGKLSFCAMLKSITSRKTYHECTKGPGGQLHKFDALKLEIILNS